MSGKQPRDRTSKHKRPSGRPAGGIAALAGLLCITAGFLMPRVSAAQQWLFVPEVELGVQYIDNPRLREEGETNQADEPETLTGGLLGLGIALQRNTETSYVVIRPATQIYRYTDDNEDTEGYFFDFDTGSTGQRSAWNFRANYQQQQVYRAETTSAELDDIGIEDDVQTGSGRTFEPRQRDMFRVRPGFTFDISERTALDLKFNYLDVRYDQQEPGEAVNYRDGQLDAVIVQSLSQESTVEFGVFASRYEPDGDRRETQAIGARVRYSLDVSDVSGFFVEVGSQESEIKAATDAQIDLSETSFLWNVGYNRRFEVTTLRLDAGQAVTPSGSGVMVERDLYRATLEHQLQPRWALLLSAVAMNTATLGVEDIVTTNDRDYLQGRATLSYQMTPSWAVEGLYALTHQDFAHIEGDAQEHEFGLSLIYRPPIPTAE